MTREEELIELLDKETTAQECGKDLSAEQQKTIEDAFRSFGVRGEVIHTANAPQVNCFVFAVENGQKLKSLCGIRKKIETTLGVADSRRLIGSDDAVYLVGHGDMLFHGPCGEALTRIQCPLVKSQESTRIVERLLTLG